MHVLKAGIILLLGLVVAAVIGPIVNAIAHEALFDARSGRLDRSAASSAAFAAAVSQAVVVAFALRTALRSYRNASALDNASRQSARHTAEPSPAAPPVPKPTKTAAMEATRRRDPVATSSPSHEPKSKNMTLFNYKNRIERIERLVFPFLDLSTPDYGAKGFSPGVIHAGAENVVRFRFAVMNILFEATSGLADRTSVNQEIYNETSSSLSGFMVDVGRLVPQNDCVPGLDFNIRTFRSLDRQLKEEDVVTGNLVLKELVNLYGKKSLEWLRKRSKSGMAADGMFLLGMATGKPQSDIVLETETLRLVAAILAEPREFDQAIKRSESELQEAFGNKQPSAGLNENSHRGSKSADAGPATKYSGSSEQMPQTKNTTKATPPSIENYPKAQMAIEYSPVVAEAWKRVQKLGEPLQKRFLSELDQGSVQDVPELLEKLEQEHLRTVRPLDTDDANDALEQARTISAEAEAEFLRAYEVVKLQVTPEDLLAKIEVKFGKSQATKEREEAERKQREVEERKRREEEERKRREEEERKRREEEERRRLLYERDKRRIEEERQRIEVERKRREEEANKRIKAEIRTPKEAERKQREEEVRLERGERERLELENRRRRRLLKEWDRWQEEAITLRRFEEGKNQSENAAGQLEELNLEQKAREALEKERKSREERNKRLEKAAGRRQEKKERHRRRGWWDSAILIVLLLIFLIGVGLLHAPD